MNMWREHYPPSSMCSLQQHAAAKRIARCCGTRSLPSFFCLVSTVLTVHQAPCASSSRCNPTHPPRHRPLPTWCVRSHRARPPPSPRRGLASSSDRGQNLIFFPWNAVLAACWRSFCFAAQEGCTALSTVTCGCADMDRCVGLGSRAAFPDSVNTIFFPCGSGTCCSFSRRAMARAQEA